MGMYTQLFIDTFLLKQTPNDVIETLNQMINDESNHWENKLDWVFNSSSYYFSNNHYARLEYDDIYGGYKLLVLCDFKNYDNEINTFIEWIKPYLFKEKGEMYGYYRYEEDVEPTILYKE
jgi:hypothetical protein